MEVWVRTLVVWEFWFLSFVYKDEKDVHFQVSIPLTQRDVATILCEWTLLAYGSLGSRSLTAILQSQPPSLELYQTQQIKNGTDQTQRGINPSSHLQQTAQTSQISTLIIPWWHKEESFNEKCACLLSFCSLTPSNTQLLGFTKFAQVNHLLFQWLWPLKLAQWKECWGLLWGILREN